MDWGNPSRRRPAGRRTTGQRAACALLAAAALAPLPAAAQQASDAGRLQAEVLEPVFVTNPADMDFGDITPRGSSGTVVMTASASATCTPNNGILHAGFCQAAHFEGDVNFLFLLRVTKPVGNQITLTGPGGATMLLNNFTFGAGPGMLTLGSTATEQRYLILNFDGTFDVYVGGTLNVAASQMPGVYNGTFLVTFNYD